MVAVNHGHPDCIVRPHARIPRVWRLRPLPEIYTDRISFFSYGSTSVRSRDPDAAVSHRQKVPGVDAWEDFVTTYLD